MRPRDSEPKSASPPPEEDRKAPSLSTKDGRLRFTNPVIICDRVEAAFPISAPSLALFTKHPRTLQTRNLRQAEASGSDPGAGRRAAQESQGGEEVGQPFDAQEGCPAPGHPSTGRQGDARTILILTFRVSQS